MRRATLAVLACLLSTAIAVPVVYAQQSDAPKASKAKKAVASKVKAAPGMKTCNYRFPDGERRTWTCRKEEPCCAWDAIKYVKCGSTVTNCL